jgi:hypothetical protein
MKPPWVGSGWSVTRVAMGGRSSGSASSPTSVTSSAVCRVIGWRRAGSSELARISFLDIARDPSHRLGTTSRCVESIDGT